MNTIITAVENTCIMILAIIILGRVIDILNIRILKWMTKSLGTEFTLIFANRLTFIGTIHHELSHAILLLITGAKIVKLDIFKPQGNRLGQVKYINRGNFILKAIQNTTSAIAPVMIGCITEFILYKTLGLTQSIPILILIIYTMISILLHMTMSKQDFKMAIKGLPICAILIFLVMYITKFDIFTYINV